MDRTIITFNEKVFLLQNHKWLNKEYRISQYLLKGSEIILCFLKSFAKFYLFTLRHAMFQLNSVKHHIDLCLSSLHMRVCLILREIMFYQLFIKRR